MFSMLRLLLHTLHPIQRPSLELGRKAGIYHLPWIRIGLKQQSFLSDREPNEFSSATVEESIQQPN